MECAILDALNRWEASLPQPIVHRLVLGDVDIGENSTAFPPRLQVPDGRYVKEGMNRGLDSHIVVVRKLDVVQGVEEGDDVLFDQASLQVDDGLDQSS